MTFLASCESCGSEAEMQLRAPGACLCGSEIDAWRCGACDHVNPMHGLRRAA